MSKNTKLIAFEGIDGAGKSTQIEILRQHLELQGYKVLKTKEPGATDLGKEIRRLVLHTGEIDFLTNLFLFSADRSRHIEEVINPAIGHYDYILIDRFILSTFAYQYASVDFSGIVETIVASSIKNLNLDLAKDFVNIILDIEPEKAYQRLNKNKDGQFEKRGLDFLTTCRNLYLSFFTYFPQTYIVNASLKEEGVHRRIVEVLNYVPEEANFVWSRKEES
jgi:dTMP kinase